MRYEVRLERRAERQLLALPDAMLRRVDAVLQGLAEEPRPPGVKKLRGKQDEGWRVRVGDHRVLYTVEDAEHVVTVYHLGPRGRAYR